MSPGAQQAASLGQQLFSQGQFASARDQFVHAIQLEPDQADFHYAAALCDWAAGQMDSAGHRLQIAVRLNSRHGPALAWLGEWYLNQGVIDAALTATAAAMEIDPHNHAFMQSRAWVLEAAGDSDGAWDLAKKLAATARMTPSLARLYGRLAARYGHAQQALAIINRVLGAGLAPGESSLNFTAAELLDRAGRYDEAFALALRANAMQRHNAYDPVTHAKWFDALIQYFTPQRVRALPKASLHCDKVVFIIGMPRSGTSLAEQILASHPAVHGAGELDFIYRVLLGLVGMLHADIGDYPACLDRLTQEHLNGMAEVYLKPLLAMRPDAARITDKMPLNFMHLGLIAALFPAARVIHCRRDPMDTCLSCFLTHFNSGHEFKRNLTHAGHFYRQYERLMAHWKNVIELPILDLDYESVVSGTEHESRRMVEFLGLPWDERCLNFHNTGRPCATASVQQVRRPVYATSVRRWKHYEKHLGPLKSALWGN